jgi:hypothetical protein
MREQSPQIEHKRIGGRVLIALPGGVEIAKGLGGIGYAGRKKFVQPSGARPTPGQNNDQPERECAKDC